MKHINWFSLFDINCEPNIFWKAFLEVEVELITFNKAFTGRPFWTPLF